MTPDREPVHSFISADYGDGSNSNYLLECPYCTCPNVHHGDVIEYSRPSGEDTQTIARTPGDSRSTPSAFNPSSRRDAVSIGMFCEWGHRFVFDVTQHKGVTFLSVRFLEEMKE